MTTNIGLTIFSDMFARSKQEFSFSFDELASHVRADPTFGRLTHQFVQDRHRNLIAG